jgi:hypothetical protein
MVTQVAMVLLSALAALATKEFLPNTKGLVLIMMTLTPKGMLSAVISQSAPKKLLQLTTHVRPRARPVPSQLATRKWGGRTRPTS